MQYGIVTPNEASGAPTIVIAADRALWQETLRDLVAKDRLADVVSVCQHLDELRAQVVKHSPRAVLARPPISGLSQLEDLLDLRLIQPELAFVLILQHSMNPQSVVRMARAGRVAIMTTEAHGAEVRGALTFVLAGWTLLAPSVKSNELQALASLREPRPAEVSISERERCILEALAHGVREERIARSMGVSVRTVQLAISHVREKLNATDRTHAVVLALDMGIISLPSDT